MSLRVRLEWERALKVLARSGFEAQALRARARFCARCSLCCSVRGVVALGKAPGVGCPSVRPSGGCSIYASRPGECADYYCGWRLGFLPRSWRPDALGVVPDLNSEGGVLGWTVRCAEGVEPRTVAAVVEALGREYPLPVGVVPFGLPGGERICLVRPGSPGWLELLSLLRSGVLPGPEWEPLAGSS